MAPLTRSGPSPGAFETENRTTCTGGTRTSRVTTTDAAVVENDGTPLLEGGFGNGPCRDRTYDLGIKSPLLCQLS